MFQQIKIQLRWERKEKCTLKKLCAINLCMRDERSFKI